MSTLEQSTRPSQCAKSRRAILKSYIQQKADGHIVGLSMASTDSVNIDTGCHGRKLAMVMPYGVYMRSGTTDSTVFKAS